jgi:hypothetical protein
MSPLAGYRQFDSPYFAALRWFGSERSLHFFHAQHSMRAVQTEENPKIPTEVRRTSLVAPTADLDRIKEIGQANERTFSQELRWLIRRRIEEWDGQPEPEQEPAAA